MVVTSYDQQFHVHFALSKRAEIWAAGNYFEKLFFNEKFAENSLNCILLVWRDAGGCARGNRSTLQLRVYDETRFFPF